MSEPLSMLLGPDDRRLLEERVMAKMGRDCPDRWFNADTLRSAIHAEADALVATGEFAYLDGILIRPGTDLTAIAAEYGAAS